MSETHETYELEIRTRNAKGDEGTIYAEVKTVAKTPQGAAQEVMSDVVAHKGPGAVRLVDTSR